MSSLFILHFIQYKLSKENSVSIMQETNSEQYIYIYAQNYIFMTFILVFFNWLVMPEKWYVFLIEGTE